MKTTVLLSALLTGVLLSANGALAAGTFYKWVDDEGVTHYTEAPPPGQGETEQVRTWNSASSDQQGALQRLEQRRADDAKAREQAAREQRSKKEPEQVATERCDEHRKNLETLRNKPVVRVQSPETGELRTLDAEERETMINDTEAALEQCEKFSGASD